ncbi:uncharacterized protein LOC26528843 isoform X1 [Drosophila willistoni]|uniref:uncharacterized protein LOC26528843 isoform X1 n=1 Tax=Drosophila willistoni TaxID=7260 RepID=UPI000C26CDA8|nr:uncharacterized protein LOC26528843 isoform X1 [Drosophila willistoni]
MWFEILPGAVIITVAMSVPIYAMYGLQKLTLGNAFRRNMDERFDRVMYQRDFRLTNNPYLMNGLESISDENRDEENDQTAKEDFDVGDDPDKAKNQDKNTQTIEE